MVTRYSGRVGPSRALFVTATALLLIASPRAVHAGTTWSAAAGVGAVHTSFASVASLRGAVVTAPGASVGLQLQGGLINSDAQQAFAMAIHVAATYRRRFGGTIGPGLRPFWGGLAGVGLWTACVSAEQCGGFGPSLGLELGVETAVYPHLHAFSVIRSDVQSGLFGPQATILVTSWMVGLTL